MMDDPDRDNAAEPVARIDPYRGFNFRLILDNTVVAAFRECDGLTLDPDSADNSEEPAIPPSPPRLVGLRKYTNITLKRGYVPDMDLWNWYQNLINGTASRRNGSIILEGEENTDVLRWNFVNGWISKWEGPAATPPGNDVAIESIEISHEGVVLA